MSPETRPVLVVGAGPTGMTAAMELARFGVPVRLIEKTAAPSSTSRAIGVQARTLELFEQRGLADPLVQSGVRGLAGSIYFARHGSGKRVFRLEFSHLDSRYNYILFVSQADTERILREQLAREGVTIERPVEMIALAQPESIAHPGQSAGVVAALRHKDGLIEEVEASYLICAEGAHSIVRSTLGFDFRGKAFSETYMLGDFYVDSDLPETDFHIFSSDYGFLALFPLGNRRFRLIASNPLTKPSTDSTPGLDELQKVYDMRSYIPARFHDMTWSSWFRINSRMIERLQERRIFFGGDAAHIHSPAGAQGMNTGIQDMINLGWKLAMVTQGRASERLLATYDDDRIPVIRSVLTSTEGLTHAIGSENAVLRTIFNHVAPLLVGSEIVKDKSTAQMSQIHLNYRDSPLSETHGHQGCLCAGDRLPDLTLRAINMQEGGHQGEKSARLFSLLDPSKLTLLHVNTDGPVWLDAEAQSKLAMWEGLINNWRIERLKSDPGERGRFIENFGPDPALVLVRPDSYIGFIGTAESAVDRLAIYLDKWFLPAAG